MNAVLSFYFRPWAQIPPIPHPHTHPTPPPPHPNDHGFPGHSTHVQTPEGNIWTVGLLIIFQGIAMLTILLVINITLFSEIPSPTYDLWQMSDLLTKMTMDIVLIRPMEVHHVSEFTNQDLTILDIILNYKQLTPQAAPTW